MSTKWTLNHYHLPLKLVWKISRGQTSAKDNFVVEYQSGKLLGLGEVAPNIRYGETADKIKEEFVIFQKNFVNDTDFFSYLQSCFLSNSLRSAIECAYIHAHREEFENIFLWKSLKNKKLKTSFSLPILETHEIESFYHKWNLDNFSTLKVKVDQNNFLDNLLVLTKLSKAKLRIDANEAFDDWEKFYGPLEKNNLLEKIEFFEEPFPANRKDLYQEFKEHTKIPLIADESMTKNVPDLELKECFDGINIKLQKARGLKRSLEQLQAARKLDMLVLVGCMVETSLGISSIFPIASQADYVDLDGFLFLEKDPFDLIKVEGENLTLNPQTSLL
jgi:L-alanine-DL-glutamate epimerase-like enolase superfamily enzyme